MPKEIAKAYEAKEFEDKIYEKWEKSGFFNPDKLQGDPYSVMMPPPNVTGVLHLGHALENALMDVNIRFQRMNGKKALLIPGTDHAAVATQAKVERVLTERGIANPRQELGREKLLEEIRNYAENSKATILKQVRKIGTSCDWSRLAYTFDDRLNKAVNEIFVRMYEDGLIYRGYKVINWTVKGQSTCSDDELEYKERQTKLYTFKYSKDFPITIATTRPETKLGDTAVAVHPGDERYMDYIGKTYTVDVGAAKPLEIKIIADENVEPEFGTGALGVTPAHSPVDFEMYEKQKAKNDPIGLIPVIGKDGRMTAEAGKDYEGLTVIEAREKFVAWLKAEGLLLKEDEISQSVGTSDRYKDVVESLPMTQWFVDVNKKIPGRGKSLKELMKEAVATGHNGDPTQKVSINPAQYEKIYYNWIDNLRDWCISRQIWWGHRIPVWYKGEETYAGTSAPAGDGWKQDEDTLDTWFSSGLWTFSTLGWPEKTEDLDTFHPSSWMQLGHEILFFWMARMILMSTYALDQIPFKNVYIHGMLRDEKGNKFSKSAGNNIDPIDISDRFGTDALRYSLLNGVAPGQDSKYYEEKVESARNLVNKLWNISRYILTSYEKPAAGPDKASLTAADAYIIHKMKILIGSVTEDFNEYRFSLAAEKLHDFTWNDLAEWYLESSKFEESTEKNRILYKLIKDLLKLWHPFIPFVTEAIWENLDEDKLLIVSRWPSVSEYDFATAESDVQAFDIVKECIKSIRNARSENKVEPSRKAKAVIYAKDRLGLLQKNAILVAKLKTGIESLEIKEGGDKIDNAIFVQVGNIEIYLLGAVDEEKEKARILKEIENLEKLVAGISSKLNNEDFVKNAPQMIVAKEKEKFEKYQNELKGLKEKINQ